MAILQGRSLEETKAAVSSEEFSKWGVYFGKEPVWYDRLEFMLAQVCTTVYNTSAARGKNSKVAKPQDFIPPYWSGVRRQKEDQILAAKNAALSQVRQINPNLIKEEK